MDDELREAERQGDAPRYVTLWRRAGLPPPAEATARALWLRGLLDELDRSVDEDERAYEPYKDRDDQPFLSGPSDSERTITLRSELTSFEGAVEALAGVAEDPATPDRLRVRATKVLCGLEPLPVVAVRRLASSPDRAVHDPAYLRLERSTPGPAALREALSIWSTRDLLRLLSTVVLDDAPWSPWPSAEDHAARIGPVREVLRDRELEPLLDDADGWVRRDALLELLVRRDERAWAPLARVVTTHPDLHARTFAWSGLLSLDRDRALDLALSLVEGSPAADDPVAVGVFKSAASLLLDAADPRARAPLAITVARGGDLGEWVRGSQGAWSEERAGRRLAERLERLPSTIWMWRRCGETLERMAEKAR